MIGDIKVAKKVYIVCGATNMCNGIDGLVNIIRGKYKLDPFTQRLFVFCNRKQDRIKILLWEGDGFVLLYKRLDYNQFKWPQNENEAKNITLQQFEWLMSGKSLDEPTVVKYTVPNTKYH
jgi:transposase